jgi:hypothetical protein
VNDIWCTASIHRAFLEIAECQDIIKEMGCGPNKDEPRHDPPVG